jgi:hypothetical protein
VFANRVETASYAATLHPYPADIPVPRRLGTLMASESAVPTGALIG